MISPGWGSPRSSRARSPNPRSESRSIRARGAPDSEPCMRSRARTRMLAVVLVRAAGRVALVYELHIANVGARPLQLERVEVRDADLADAVPVAVHRRPKIEHDIKLL